MEFAQLKFAQPSWLAITLVTMPLLVWAFHHFNRKRLADLQSFASARLLPGLTISVSSRLRLLKNWLLVLGMGLCLFSLARPQWGYRWEETKRKGIDILFAVDTSRSMLAQDVNPDRLTRARLAVLDLLAKLPGDRVGLVAFAGTAFLQCPLTLDYDAFRQSLEALDTAIILYGGTSLAAAIREAENTFSLGNPSHRILVLITDGEDLEAGGIAAAREAAREDVRIFTVGVGTHDGELIPIRDASGKVEFLKDEKGQAVKSRLDESTLRQVAEVTGGFYEPLGQRGEGLETIYDRGLAALPKQELSSRMNMIYTERFQWFLAAGIFCLVLEMLLGERRRTAGSKWRLPRLKFPKTSAVILLLAGVGFSTAQASPQSAEKAYRDGKFEDAYRQYKMAAEKKPKKPELQFNLGAAGYKSGRFEEASAAFQKALPTDWIDLQEQTFYNLGNTQYRLGQQTEKTNPQQTIQSWQQALKSYENALQLKKDDADAKFNHELVKKKLEQLQKQQPEEQQNKQDSQDQKKDVSGQSDKDRKDQQKDRQDQGGQDQKDQKDPSRDNKQSKDDARQKDQPKDSQPGSADEKPKDEPKKQQPRPSGGEEKKNDGKKEQPEPVALPGQMTREEAKSLLDSLKNDERKMPVTATMKQGGQLDDTPRRDW